MSIATAIQNAQAKVAAAYTKCNAKGATMPLTQDLSNLADCIDSISTGGGSTEVEENDVIFIDYDGTRLYSYSKAEFLALSSFPANPTHSGLTAQGWNWDLVDAKAYVTECDSLVIGQMYVTDDGKTRLYITLDDSSLLSPTFYIPTGSTIDWGDGTTQTTSGSIQHTYTSTGNYEVVITHPVNVLYPALANVASVLKDYAGILRHVRLGIGGDLFSTYAFQYNRNLEDITLPNNITSFQSGAIFNGATSLKAVVLPKNFVTSGNYAFKATGSLRYISMNKTLTAGVNPIRDSSVEILNIPPSISSLPANMASFNDRLRKVTTASGTTSILGSAFQSCSALSSVKLTNGITQIGDYAFNDTFSLTHITLPSSLTTIGQRVFQGSCITEITIPENVTSIGNYAFYNTPWLAEVHVKPTTPPTAGGGIFQAAYALTKIYVPTGKLSAYQSASGWSGYASLMEEE